MLTCTASFDNPASRRPATFIQENYAQGILEERRRAAVTITAAVFSPCGRFLVCASDSGKLAIWELSPYMERDAWSGTERPDTSPDLSFYADTSCINSVAFAEDLLLCGGDESLLAWPFGHLLSVMETGEAPGEPVMRIQCPQRKVTRGGLLPYPEINDARYDQATQRVLCAAGDSMAYEWDLQSPSSPVCTYEGHQGYLHAVANARGSSLLATASEDGLVGLWDRRTQPSAPTFGNAAGRGSNAIAFLGPARLKPGNGLKAPTQSKRSGAKGEQDSPGGDCWVAAAQMDDGGHTLVCGGGGAVDGAWSAAQKRGWLTRWNLATRTAISETPLSSEVQCVVETEEGHTVVIGGAEPRVSFLKKTMLEKRSSTPVSPQSVYALAINSGTHNAGVTCIAGVGPVINICTIPGIISFSLNFL